MNYLRSVNAVLFGFMGGTFWDDKPGAALVLAGLGLLNAAWLWIGVQQEHRAK